MRKLKRTDAAKERERMLPRQGTTKRMVLQMVLESESGITQDDIAHALFELGRIPEDHPRYIRCRLTELERDGLIKIVGRKRSPRSGRRAAIWKGAKK